MNLTTWDLVDALGTRKPGKLIATSFSLYELELFRLATYLGLDDRSDAVFRFDPAGFRGWGKQRIVPPRWLYPLAPTDSSLHNAIKGPTLPAVFHPKTFLVPSKSGYNRLVISTGNIATVDQHHMSNLVCRV